MACNECNEPLYTPTIVETNNNSPCSCPIKDLSTDCVLYTGDPLECSSTATNTVLTDVLKKIDTFICTKFSESINYLQLTNIGLGSEVYKGISGTGKKELRTIISENTNLLDIIQNPDTIGIQVGTHSLTHSNETDILSLTVTTISGNTTLSTIDLSDYNQEQSDYLENNTSSKSHILNRNPTKTINSNYTVVITDNNYIIEVDNGISDVTIDLTGALGTDNFFVGFVQKGTGNVTFTGATSIPQDLTNVLYGQGHACALEIINSTKYLIGQLKLA